MGPGIYQQADHADHKEQPAKRSGDPKGDKRWNEQCHDAEQYEGNSLDEKDGPVTLSNVLQPFYQGTHRQVDPLSFRPRISARPRSQFLFFPLRSYLRWIKAD